MKTLLDVWSVALELLVLVVLEVRSFFDFPVAG